MVMGIFVMVIGSSFVLMNFSWNQTGIFILTSRMAKSRSGRHDCNRLSQMDSSASSVEQLLGFTHCLGDRVD
jgi:hypothetical protein